MAPTVPLVPDMLLVMLNERFDAVLTRPYASVVMIGIIGYAPLMPPHVCTPGPVVGNPNVTAPVAALVLNVVVIPAVDNAVTRPYASVVITGMLVELPTVVAPGPVAGRV